MPDKLRRDPLVLSLIQEFHRKGQLIAAICHGRLDADLGQGLSGVKVTGSPGIKDDLNQRRSGMGRFPVVVDRHFVSAQAGRPAPVLCCMLEVLQRQG